MKKFLIFLIFIFTIILPVQAHHCHNHAYVTYQDFYQEELRFPNCNKHYLLKETTTYFYSNLFYQLLALFLLINLYHL